MAQNGLVSSVLTYFRSRVADTTICSSAARIPETNVASVKDGGRPKQSSQFQASQMKTLPKAVAELLTKSGVLYPTAGLQLCLPFSVCVWFDITAAWGMYEV